MFRLMRAIIRLTNTVQVRRRKYNCQLDYTSRSRVWTRIRYMYVRVQWLNQMYSYIHVPNSGSYARSRGIVQLTVALSSSYLYRICKPEDGSHEPKRVAPCWPLFLINNSNLYFIVCDWRLIVLVDTHHTRGCPTLKKKIKKYRFAVINCSCSPLLENMMAYQRIFYYIYLHVSWKSLLVSRRN